MHEIVPLVVHAGICGAMRSLLGQRTSKGVIQAEMQARVASKRSLFRVLFDTMVTGLSRLNDVLLEPFLILVRKMRELSDSALAASLVQWSVMPRVQQVSFSDTVGISMFRRCGATFEPGHMEMTLKNAHIPSMPADHARAELRLDALREQVQKSCEGTLKESTVEVGPVVEQLVTECDEAEEMRRKAAISECIEEHHLEARQIADKCREIHKAVTDVAGEPIPSALVRRAEEYGQPDLWRVDGGLLIESALGVPLDEFRHSAVHAMIGGIGEVLTVIDREYEIDGEIKECKEVGDATLHGWVLVFDRLIIHNGPAILDALHAALEVPHRYQLEVMRGAPGCGKTYTLLSEMGPDDVALCPAREAALDTRSRAEEKYPHYTRPRWRVSSLDSYLCNFQKRRSLRAVVLRADEIYMSRAGYFYAAAGLLGCEAVKGYGDIKQIPPFTRVQMVALHKQVTPQVISDEFRVFRLPGDSLAAVAHLYDFKCRTFNKISKSLKVVTDWRMLELPEGKVYALVMYQADKKEVRKLLRSLIDVGKVVVMSVHESQGKTLSNVWLFRMDSRPRSDNMCLFDRPEYCLVAMTRHDKSFAYIRPRDLGDLIDQWVVKGSDPRRIAAAMDASTIGQSVEML
uniref:ORF1 n=1 Tax=Plasmopara viticola lesion associated vivivirus 4 TaxID=2770123 RepID=A0A7H0RR08_9VIRU|nr:ORF1 [Plasmopara viticola lesion associated vivivirus 4]